MASPRFPATVRHLVDLTRETLPPMHIHAAAAGIAGPIVFPMVQTAPGGNTWTTSGQLTSAQVATLNASGYYINVHSAAFPNGEIRGQIVPTQAIVLQPAANSGGGGGGGGGY
jgi:hypothetical protein